MPLPRPTVRTDLHEGQGERKDGDGYLQPLYSGRRNAITSCFSICIRSPLVPCTFSATSYGPIILFTAVVDRDRWAHSSEVQRRDVTAAAMQTHSGAEHAQGPGAACT